MGNSKMTIVTVTVNPMLDILTSVECMVPENKLHCQPPSLAAGGGGIYVSRAIKNLGGVSTALFIAGGINGMQMKQLLKDDGIDFQSIDSGVNTRENWLIMDNRSEKLYRFVLPGDEIEDKHWKALLKMIKDFSPKPDYLIVSGCLAPGIPDNFYAQIAAFARKNDIRMVLDTSGTPLKLALEERVHMIKPNLREMAELYQKKGLTGMELEQAAKEILVKGYCNLIVVSMGEKGALVSLQDDRVEYIVPPAMPVASNVGAGDSMVAGMIVGCSKGFWSQQAVRYGVAAGTAATMNPANELCKKEDTDEIFEWLSQKNGED